MELTIIFNYNSKGLTQSVDIRGHLVRTWYIQTYIQIKQPYTQNNKKLYILFS